MNTKKSVLNPAQVIQFLGLSADGGLASSNQNQTNSSGGSQVSKGKKTISACMLAQLLDATNCVLSTGPVLSLPANGTNKHTGAELPMLQSTSPANTRVSGGAGKQQCAGGLA